MPPDKTVDTVLLIIVGGLLTMGLGSLALGWVVKTYDRVMSRWTVPAPDSRPSSQETDVRQTPDVPALPRMKAEELLTVCKLMRVHGIKREDAQAAFTASGLPFNNNVWASAAPLPPTDNYRTPVAGRSVDPRLFQTDPDLVYQPPD